MSNNTVVITETNGKYHLQNNGMSEFALIGILECVLLDLKTAAREEPVSEQKKSAAKPEKALSEAKEIEKASEPETEKQTAEEPVKETAQNSGSPDLRTRIGNAVKAIKTLGGEASADDLKDATDEELQAELESLTNQYKRLKSSKAGAK